MTLSEHDSKNLSGFLYWLADRIVHVYGESPNVDFVLATREWAKKLDPEYIVAVALHPGKGDIFLHMMAPARHHQMIHSFGQNTANYIQGFMTNKYRFLNRQAAWDLAKEAGQIKQQTGPEGTLFSEDLW